MSPIARLIANATTTGKTDKMGVKSARAPEEGSKARIELVRSSRPASRAPCAYAAVAHDVSRLVFTAGAYPLDDSGAIVAVGDVAGQAERVMT